MDNIGRVIGCVRQQLRDMQEKCCISDEECSLFHPHEGGRQFYLCIDVFVSSLLGNYALLNGEQIRHLFLSFHSVLGSCYLGHKKNIDFVTAGTIFSSVSLLFF